MWWGSEVGCPSVGEVQMYLAVHRSADIVALRLVEALVVVSVILRHLHTAFCLGDSLDFGFSRTGVLV